MQEEFKIVSQLDEDDYLVGPAYAFENPVRPGTYLIPGGAIDEPVPDVQEGKRAKWLAPGWKLEDLPAEPEL